MSKKVRMRLGEAGNTWNPALLVLKAKGYNLKREDYGKGKDQRTQYWAKRDGYEFAASEPLALLGLVSIWENRGRQWQRQDSEPDLDDRLVEDMLAREDAKKGRRNKMA